MDSGDLIEQSIWIRKNMEKVVDGNIVCINTENYEYKKVGLWLEMMITGLCPWSIEIGYQKWKEPRERRQEVIWVIYLNKNIEIWVFKIIYP